jgi:hypothetical protein
MKKRLLEAELKPVDAVAVRYYDSQREFGPMHPLERLRLLKDGAVFGGPSEIYPDDLAAFDSAHAHAPTATKLLMDVWYKSGDPSYLKAARLGISRAALYVRWKSALWYFKGALEKKSLTS